MLERIRKIDKSEQKPSCDNGREYNVEIHVRGEELLSISLAVVLLVALGPGRQFPQTSVAFTAPRKLASSPRFCK